VPLYVPRHPDTVWSANFISDALSCGRRFRLFDVVDDFNRGSREPLSQVTGGPKNPGAGQLERGLNWVVLPNAVALLANVNW
jgi:hypothetical protein